MASPRYSPSKRAPPTKQRMLRKNVGTKLTPYWTPARFQPAEERWANFIVSKNVGSKGVDLYRFKPLPATEEMVHDLERLTAKRRSSEGKYHHVGRSINRAIKVIPDALLVRSMLAAHGVNRLPTVHEVAAMAVLRYGIDSPQLGEYLTNMKSLYRGHRVLSFWQSTPEALVDATRYTHDGKIHNILAEAEEVLRHSKTQSLTARQIAQKMGLTYTAALRIQLSAVLKLLSAAQLIRDQPESRVPGEKQVSIFWSHRGNPNPVPDTMAPYVRILQWFAKGKIGTGKSSFYIFTPFGKKIPIPRVQYRSLTFLTQQGLVEREKETKHWQLTPKGKRLMYLASRRKELPEELRKLLSIKNKRE